MHIRTGAGTDYHIGMLKLSEHRWKILCRIRSVRIRNRNYVIRSRKNSRLERCSISTIVLVLNYACSGRPCFACGRIFRSVINNDDLRLYVRPLKHPAEFKHSLGNCKFLVECRDDYAHPFCRLAIVR